VASNTAAQPVSTVSSSRLAGPPIVPLIAVIPALAVYGLFILWPAAWVVILSFQQWTGYGPATFDGLLNYGQLFADPLFQTSLRHSLLWELGAVLAVVPGLGIALVLHHSRRPALWLAVLFFPALLPATVVAALWVMLYSPLSGPINSVLAALGAGQPDWLGDPHLALPALFVAWVWATIGIVALVLWTGLRAIGREFLDLAAVEGAGAWATFRLVILPALRRPLAIAVLLEAALGLQVFDLIFVTTGGAPGYATMILPVDIYGRAFGGQSGQGAAEAVIALALSLVLVVAASLLFGRPGPVTWEETPGRPVGVASIAAAVLAILALLPLLWLLPATAQSSLSFALGQTAYSLSALGQNFQAAWTAGAGGALLTSVLLAGAVVILSLALAFPAAFVLGHALPRAARAGILGLLLFGLFQPTMVSIIPLFRLLKDLGLLDSPWGIILPDVARALALGVPVLWIGVAGMAEILEAAATDGADMLRQALYIALPLARPALALAAAWAFVTSWNDYLLPTVVSQDGSLQTVPTLLGSFIGRYDTQYGALAAGTILGLALPACLWLLATRAQIITSRGSAA